MRRLMTLLLVLAIPSTALAQQPEEVMQWVIDHSIVELEKITVESLSPLQWELFSRQMGYSPYTRAVTNSQAVARKHLWVRLSPYPEAHTAYVWVHEALHYVLANLGRVGNEQIFHSEYSVKIHSDAIICSSEEFKKAFPNVRMLPDDLMCDEKGFVVPIN